jgi:ComF family protein
MLSADRVLPAPLKRATGAARSALRRMLDLALPPLCAACREPVEGRGLCPACWSKLSFITKPFCERLGTPFVYDPGPGILSMEAIADPPAYHRARAAVRFDEISRALVHALKYSDRLDLAPMMGRWLSQAGRELLAEADALVPVPLHWRRSWARRFNQSAMLAAAVSSQTGVPIATGALKRVKPTAQQVGLSRTERAANVQGAFRVPKDGKAAVTGRRLVLVDDVLTSGATVDGCARRCCAPGPPVSTYWFLPGLPSRRERPYNSLLKITPWPTSISIQCVIARIARTPRTCFRAKA